MARTPKEEQRDKILEAALNVFSQQGLEAARMDDIAAGARVSKGTLYNVFENKEDLFFELCLSALRTYGDLLCENLERELPVRQAVKLTIERTIASLPAQEPFFYLFFDLWARIGRDARFRDRCFQAFQECYGEYQKHLANLVRRGQDEGLFPSIDPESLALLIIATFDGIIYQWTFNREKLNLPLLTQTLIQLACAGTGLQLSQKGSPTRESA